MGNFVSDFAVSDIGSIHFRTSTVDYFDCTACCCHSLDASVGSVDVIVINIGVDNNDHLRNCSRPITTAHRAVLLLRMKN